MWGLSRAQLAWLFPAQFFASSVGSVVSSLRPRWSLVGGYGAMAAGLGVVAFSPWPGPLAGFAVVGLGLGLVAAATNLRVARAASATGRSAGGDLSLLNVLWGLGALACPLVFAAAEGRLGVQALLLSAAVLIAVPAFLLAGLPPTPSKEPPTSEPDRTASEASSLRVALGLLPVAGLFFCYVGIEATLGGWLVAYAESLAAEAGGSAAVGAGVVPLLIGSGFWAALLAGRLLAPWILRHLSERRLFVVALAVSMTGALGLRFAVSETMLAAASLLVGFGLAPVFPLAVSFLAAQTERTGGRQTGWVFAFAGLGGAVLPWLTARLPAADASLARGFLVPVAAILAMGFLFVVQTRVASSSEHRVPDDC